jgi:hypothetical protein
MGVVRRASRETRVIIRVSTFAVARALTTILQYYHCTDYHGSCENTDIREERLGELLGDAIRPIQITAEIADQIATALQASDTAAERHRTDALRQLEQRRRAIVARWTEATTTSWKAVSPRSSGGGKSRLGKQRCG